MKSIRKNVIKDAEKLAKQQAEEEKQQTPPKETGFIAVSAGAGLTEIFRELGVDYLIEGGQTMNPSTEDMLNAIDKGQCENDLYSSRIIKISFSQLIRLAILTKDKEIIVVPTKTIPQGITAMISFVSRKKLRKKTLQK